MDPDPPADRRRGLCGMPMIDHYFKGILLNLIDSKSVKKSICYISKRPICDELYINKLMRWQCFIKHQLLVREFT